MLVSYSVLLLQYDKERGMHNKPHSRLNAFSVTYRFNEVIAWIKGQEYNFIISYWDKKNLILIKEQLSSWRWSRIMLIFSGNKIAHHECCPTKKDCNVIN